MKGKFWRTSVIALIYSGIILSTITYSDGSRSSDGSSKPILAETDETTETILAESNETSEPSPSEIEVYISRLRQGDPSAFEALVAYGAKATPSLIDLLQDEDENLRIVAIAILGEIGAGELDTVSPLVRILQDRSAENRDSRIMAIHALEKFGKPAIPALIGSLGDEDFYVRSDTALVLGRIGKPVVPDLITALRTENSRVGYWAAAALGKIGKPAVPDLIAAINDENSDVR